MFLKHTAVSVALAAALLSGCTATGDSDPKDASPSADVTTHAAAGDMAAQAATATKWGDKWCLIKDGMTKSQALRVMGASTKDHPSDALLWGDKDFQFGVHLTKRDIVSGWWSAAPPKSAPEVLAALDCAH